MAAQRHVGRHGTVHRVLCRAIRRRHCANSGDAVGRVVPGANPGHLGLRDLTLPADGRGHHLPAGLRVHAVHAGRARRREHVGVHAGTARRRTRADDCHPAGVGGSVQFRAVAWLDPKTF